MDTVWLLIVFSLIYMSRHEVQRWDTRLEIFKQCPAYVYNYLFILMCDLNETTIWVLEILMFYYM